MTGILSTPFRHSIVLGALALAAILAYGRAFSLPLISDDYLVIALSRDFGPVEHWRHLLDDPLYRNRSTFMVLTWWMYSAFGLWYPAYLILGLALHIANSWLIYAFRPWLGSGIAAGAALFFALHEGHQEAVIWYSAYPELLVFVFGGGSLFCWLRFLDLGGLAWWTGSLALCGLALLSKESGVAVLPLLAVAALLRRGGRLRPALQLVPFALLHLAYVWWVFNGQSRNHHFEDGTFSLRAPFWLTLPNSIGRLLWFWGLLALPGLFWRKPGGGVRWLAVTLFGMAITLLPYSFLTYMPRVPSRHTYMASGALAVLIAAGMLGWHERLRKRWFLPVILAAVLVHNCGYLWIRKHPQYVARGASTEALIRLARSAEGPIFVEAFPFGERIARLAVELGAGKPSSLLLFRPEDKARARHVFSWKE